MYQVVYSQFDINNIFYHNALKYDINYESEKHFIYILSTETVICNTWFSVYFK